MTNREVIVALVRRVADYLENGRLAELCLQAARSDLNESGWMYALWCDGQGCCGDGDDMCSDEAHLACIQRFLDQPHEGE